VRRALVTPKAIVIALVVILLVVTWRWWLDDFAFELGLTSACVGPAILWAAARTRRRTGRPFNSAARALVIGGLAMTAGLAVALLYLLRQVGLSRWLVIVLVCGFCLATELWHAKDTPRERAQCVFDAVISVPSDH
jgi:hypothetical protein